MKKIHILGLALFAVFAFSALISTSAFAVSKFLWNAAEITANLPILVTPDANLLLLEDMGAIGTPDILCSGFFHGEIESGGVLGLITEVLKLDDTLLEETVLNLAGTSVKGDMVECEEMKTTCKNEVLVTAINLPWHVEVELSGTTFRLDFLEEAGKEPTYVVDCETALGLVEDICDGLVFALLENATGGVLGEFMEAEEPFGNCSVGGEKQGLLQGNGLITDSEGGTLTLSE